MNVIIRGTLLLVLWLGIAFPNSLYTSVRAQYYPPPGQWEQRAELRDELQPAVNFALNNEYSGERDLRLAILKGFAREPGHRLRGPVKERGGPAAPMPRPPTTTGKTDRYTSPVHTINTTTSG